jgi:hypothetical protein
MEYLTITSELERAILAHVRVMPPKRWRWSGGLLRDSREDFYAWTAWEAGFDALLREVARQTWRRVEAEGDTMPAHLAAHLQSCTLHGGDTCAVIELLEIHECLSLSGLMPPAEWVGAALAARRCPMSYPAK